MLGPIVFADWAWRRRHFRRGLLLGYRDSGQVLPLLLDNEKATQD